jgi:hypothetical protein
VGQGRLEAIYPALLAIINNIAPHLENIARATSSKIMQLFANMSSPAFLLANETNHDLLCALLEAVNAIIEHQYSSKFPSHSRPYSNTVEKIRYSFMLCYAQRRDF